MARKGKIQRINVGSSSNTYNYNRAGSRGSADYVKIRRSVHVSPALILGFILAVLIGLGAIFAYKQFADLLGGKSTSTSVTEAVGGAAAEIKNEVTIEYDTPVSLDLFFTSVPSDAKFKTDVDSIDISVPGDHNIEIESDGKTLYSTLKIVDTTPPSADPVPQEVYVDEYPDAGDCVTNVADKSEVSAEFDENTDLSTPGKKTVNVILTDEFGNQAVIPVDFTVLEDESETQATDSSESSAAADVTKAPKNTRAPKSTRAPKRKSTIVKRNTPTPVPVATKAPVVNTTAPTKAPVATKKPAPTKAPVVTKKADPTKAPGRTEATNTPKPSDDQGSKHTDETRNTEPKNTEPKTTEKKATNTPVPTKAPSKATNTPVPTKAASKATNTPAPTKAAATNTPRPTEPAPATNTPVPTDKPTEAPKPTITNTPKPTRPDTPTPPPRVTKEPKLTPEPGDDTPTPPPND